MNISKHLLKNFCLCALVVSVSNSYANPEVLAVTGEAVPATIPTIELKTSLESEKTVYLMHLNLNAEQAGVIKASPRSVVPSKVKSFAQSLSGGLLPETVDLGMNNVPALDQGTHGSCVTFAITGAVEAVLGKGDYISQLCNLTLGNYLANNSFLPSGWKGSSGSVVLNQMTTFGVIPKSAESTQVCGGLSRYPTTDSNQEGNPMTPESFKVGRVNIMNTLHWDTLLDDFQRFGGDKNKPYNPDQLIARVKTILATANTDPQASARVTFGFLIYPEINGIGTQAKRYVANDTWSLTKSTIDQLEQRNPPSAGHEIIITGYDDNAVVQDNDGTTHKGVFILRNSWGSGAGNKGNYYMTYDYFAVFTTEAYQIRKA